MITNETKVLLTVMERGTLKEARYIKERYKKYPFFKKGKNNQPMASLDGNKWYPLHKLMKISPPEKIPARFVESYHTVTHRTIINESAVQFFISDEGRPLSIRKEIWDKLQPEERLEENLALNAAAMAPALESWEYELVN